MRKILITVFATLLLLLKVKPVMAQTFGVSTSATLTSNQINYVSTDYRVVTLTKFLEKHKSPLAPYADEFVAYADMYGIDWRLVASISGVESTFGKRIPKGSYNAYGWAGGNYRFSSWKNSIKIVSQTLRENYYDKGATSIPKIARIYAPPSTTWAWKVQYFMNKIDKLPLTYDL